MDCLAITFILVTITVTFSGFNCDHESSVEEEFLFNCEHRCCVEDELLSNCDTKESLDDEPNSNCDTEEKVEDETNFNCNTCLLEDVSVTLGVMNSISLDFVNNVDMCQPFYLENNL